MTDEQLMDEYDAVAASTFVGINYYADELRRREQAAANRASDRLARASLRLSYATLVLSAVAVVIALVHH
ncbi:hypothetical protein GALL_233440 [mine drainage metagenome]|uniref:Uncharacterized protein n=1 Tax=mine drainage metagenome TaxID=410659 RepID=A0A1J5RF01_9ZZZZ